MINQFKHKFFYNNTILKPRQCVQNNLVFMQSLSKIKFYFSILKHKVLNLNEREKINILHLIFLLKLVFLLIKDSPIYCLKGHTSSISCMQIMENPTHLVSMDEDSFVRIWDIFQLKQVSFFSLKHKENFKNSKYTVNFLFLIFLKNS